MLLDHSIKVYRKLVNLDSLVFRFFQSELEMAVNCLKSR
jgi:hypothetical protein